MPLKSPQGATFESFDQCVMEISGEDTSKEEARSICGSFKEVDKESNMANSQLKKRVIEYYEDKENIEKSEFEVESDEIIKTNDEKQIAYSIALKADRPDLENDTFPLDVIEKAAHEFMAKSQDMNLEHQFDTDKVQIVESFLAPTKMEINGNEIQKGDWVVATKFLDDDLWEFAKSGDLAGFSIEGKARKVPASEVK